MGRSDMQAGQHTLWSGRGLSWDRRRGLC